MPDQQIQFFMFKKEKDQGDALRVSVCDPPAYGTFPKMYKDAIAKRVAVANACVARSRASLLNGNLEAATANEKLDNSVLESISQTIEIADERAQFGENVEQLSDLTTGALGAPKKLEETFKNGSRLFELMQLNDNGFTKYLGKISSEQAIESFKDWINPLPKINGRLAQLYVDRAFIKGVQADMESFAHSECL